MFIIGHTPQARPVSCDDMSLVGYSEPTAWRNDKKSDYRGWLFQPAMWVNFFVSCLLIINIIGMIWTVGWTGMPVVGRILVCLCLAPFFWGVCDTFLRCDIRSLWGMMISAPAALPQLIFATIWVPAYATTRCADLTWGNRKGNLLDESIKVLRRAKDGKKIAQLLVGFNSVVAGIVTVLMQHFKETFPIFVTGYILILSFKLVVSFGDLVYRVLTCHHLFNSTSDDITIEGKEVDEEHCISCNEKYIEEGCAKGQEGEENEGSDTTEIYISGGSYVQLHDHATNKRKNDVEET